MQNSIPRDLEIIESLNLNEYVNKEVLLLNINNL
jgi:hypothetical protein